MVQGDDDVTYKLTTTPAGDKIWRTRNEIISYNDWQTVYQFRPRL